MFDTHCQKPDQPVLAATIGLIFLVTTLPGMAKADTCNLSGAVAEESSNTLVLSGEFTTCKSVSVLLQGGVIVKGVPRDLMLKLFRKGNANLLADLAGVTATEGQSVLVKCGSKVKCQSVVTYPDDPVKGPPAPVAKTGQTACIDASYTTTNCTGTGQDGEIQKGVTWPDPRFTDNSDGTVTDNLTGLIWLKNPNCFLTQTWANALTSVHSLASGSCDLTDGSKVGDWRLPNIKELHSLVDFGLSVPPLPSGHPFSIEQSYIYWSSTSMADPDFAKDAWCQSFYFGSVGSEFKENSNFVWPVRGGQ